MANTKTITNANEILPWAILKRVGARAVAWDQLARAINSTNYTCRGDTTTSASFADGVVSYTATTSFAALLFNNPNPKLIANHACLIVADVTCSASKTFRFVTYGTSFKYADSIVLTAGGKRRYAVKYTPTTDEDAYGFEAINSVNGDTFAIENIQIFDLTTMNEASLTADQFRAKFPSSYYPYNTGHIIPLNPSAFKVVGKNKWDEEWELGAFNTNTGVKNPSGTAVTSKNYIPVQGGTSYYFNTGGANIYVFQYDASKNYLGSESWFRVQDIAKVLATNCAYIQLEFPASYGSVYKDDTMICLNSVTDKTYEEYKETTIDTSFTSGYKYVNENCHDYSENVLVNGVMRRKEHKGIVGEVDLGTLTWNKASNWGQQGVTLFFATLEPSWRVVNDAICAGYTVYPISIGNNLPDKGMVIGSTFISSVITTIGIADNSYSDASAFKTAMSGVMLYYEKATPSTPTLHDPIPNIPCEDGTTVTAITPQTDLVNSIDVPSTIAYMTKISS